MFFYVAHTRPNMLILHEFLNKNFRRLQAMLFTALLIVLR